MTWETESIAPAFSSTSALERMIPSMLIASLNVFACSTTSFPVIDSPMNSFKSG